MRTLVISEETETADDMIYVVQEVLRLLSEGYTSGIEPSWSLEGEDEDVQDRELDS